MGSAGCSARPVRAASAAVRAAPRAAASAALFAAIAATRASQCVGELVVRRLAHQRHQRGPLGDVHRLGGDVRRGAPVQYQSRSWPPGPQPRRSYSPMEMTSTSCRPGGYVVEGAPDRQLPAHLGLGLGDLEPLAQREAVQSAPSPPENPLRLRKMQAPSTTRSCCALVVLLDDALLPFSARLAVLPGLVG